MVGLFVDRGYFPNITSYGSSLWTFNYCHDVDDDGTSLFLFDPKQLFQMVRLDCVFLFGAIEIIFFISSIVKFFHGGFVAVLMAIIILAVMFIWEQGNIIRESAAEDVALKITFHN